MFSDPALEGNIEDSSREQRPLDGIRGLTGPEKVFDAEHERVEKLAPGGAGRYINVETIVSPPVDLLIRAAMVVSST